MPLRTGRRLGASRGICGQFISTSVSGRANSISAGNIGSRVIILLLADVGEVNYMKRKVVKECAKCSTGVS